MDTTWDCIVVGGGAAGLSAALSLGRARRSTLVIDAGHQSNRIAHGIGGLLGNDQQPPAEFYAAGHQELLAYPSVERRLGEVTAARRSDGRFIVDLAGGGQETARRVLLATGMEYRHPAGLGLEAFWGRTAFHCPFCHGWDLRGQALGVLDRGASGVHRATLLRAWSDDITLLTNGPAELDAAQRAQLDAAQVTIEERSVVAFTGHDGVLEAATLAGGDCRPLGGLLMPVTLHQRSALAAQLGAAAAPAGPLSSETLQVDAMFSTTVPGLFAAGDTSASMPSVPNAVASGGAAGAMLVNSLMAESSLPE